MVPLIEPCWVDYYGLDREGYEILSLSAASFLKPQRFDLFTRLFYIRHRRDDSRLARRVYLEGLRAFDPTWKERGREKRGPRVHIRAFDGLIDRFGAVGFDPDESLVPVGAGDVLLDGSHRVASLAFYGKDMTVVRFSNVVADPFNSEYFLGRAMSVYAADLSAHEAVGWLDGLNVLCVWPGGREPAIGDDRRLYVRRFTLGGRAYSRLRSILDPSWRGGGRPKTVPGRKNRISFVFFLPEGNGGPSVKTGADTLLVRDGDGVRRIADLALTEEGRCKWLYPNAFSGKIAFMLWRFGDRVRADSMYCVRRVKLFFASIDSAVWRWFYYRVSPLWKKKG